MYDNTTIVHEQKNEPLISMFQFSEHILRETIEAQNNACAFCGTPIDKRNKESYFSHTRGWKTDATENCIVVCPACHERIVKGVHASFDYPKTKGNFIVTKLKSSETAAALTFFFPTFGMLYTGIRFFFMMVGIRLALIAFSLFVPFPPEFPAYWVILLLGVAARAFACIFAWKVTAAHNRLLLEFIDENGLDPELYGIKKKQSA